MLLSLSARIPSCCHGLPKGVGSAADVADVWQGSVSICSLGFVLSCDPTVVGFISHTTCKVGRCEHSVAKVQPKRRWVELAADEIWYVGQNGEWRV